MTVLDVPSTAPLRLEAVLLRTYRYLRVGMALLVVLLGAAVGREIVTTRGLLDSLSAYYYTPAHTVFVAALCSIGASMVAYRGHDDIEDGVLNACGFLAFVIAFVPTEAVGSVPCDPQSQFCRVPRATVEANVEVLLWVAFVALVVTLVASRLDGTQPGTAWSRADAIAYAALVAGFAALVIWYVVARSSFLGYAHDTAAIALFAGIVAVVWQNVVRVGNEGGSRGQNRYTFGLALLLVSVIVIVAWHYLGSLQHWVFYLESSLIVQFAMFWLSQTHEFWQRQEPIH
jgi:hypothetical protein